MRYVAIQVQKYATKKVMLIEHSREERYQGGVVSQIWIEDNNGAPDGGMFYEGYTVEEVMQEYEELYDIKRSDWSTLPDDEA
jgi:hypothetical protein